MKIVASSLRSGVRWNDISISKKTRRLVVLLIWSTGLFPVFNLVHAQKPNIILILADDMGYGDLEFKENS